MSATFANLLVGLQTRSGSEARSIERINHEFGSRFPESYLRLMGASNGVEGFIASDSYLMLWPIEELPRLNEGYAVDEFVPGLTLIGSNGGSIAYAIDTRGQSPTFVAVPFEALSLDNVTHLAGTAEEFLSVLRQPTCDEDVAGGN